MSWQQKIKTKSKMLHNIDRMVIFSPKLQTAYKKIKKQMLVKPCDYLHKKNENGKLQIKVNQKEYFIRDLQDMIVWGRLTRRSQIRYSRSLHSSAIQQEILKKSKKPFDRPMQAEENNARRRENRQYKNRIVFLQVPVISVEEKTQSLVEEKLAVNKSGLSRTTFPHCDLVNLKLSGYRSRLRTIREIQLRMIQECPQSQTHSGRIGAEAEDDTNRIQSKFHKIIQLRQMVTSYEQQIHRNFPMVSSSIFIGDYLKRVCKSQPLTGNKQIADKTYAIAYMLFKTDVVRSPGALINNMQIVDLMCHGQLTLKQAFVKQPKEKCIQKPQQLSESTRMNGIQDRKARGLIQMTKVRSIKGARMMHIDYDIEKEDIPMFYKYCFPYKYAQLYGQMKKRQHQEDKRCVDELRYYEAEVNQRWVQLYRRKDQHKQTKEQLESWEKASDDIQLYVQKSTELICDKLFPQFGLSIQSPALNRMKQLIGTV